MKILRNVVGCLLAFVGIIWILQGINVLPGSFMTGQIKWAAYGAVALIAGGLLLCAGRRR